MNDKKERKVVEIILVRAQPLHQAKHDLKAHSHGKVDSIPTLSQIWKPTFCLFALCQMLKWKGSEMGSLSLDHMDWTTWHGTGTLSAQAGYG